jgi:phospholipase C
MVWKRSLTLLSVLTLHALVLPGPIVPALASPTPGVATTPIQHVVIILKENRSYDEYFGQFPNANGATQGTMSTGQVVDMTTNPTPDPMPNDINHGRGEFLLDYDNGANDAFDKAHGAFSTGGYNLAYSQMSESQIPNYWQYARTFGLADNMFSDYGGTSFGNNLFLLAAQSGRYDPSLSYRGVYTNPKPPQGQKLNRWWGCDDPIGTTVATLGADGKKSTNVFPCFTFPSLPDELNTYGISWKEYADIGGFANAHNVADAFSSIRYGSSWANDVPLSSFVTDAASGNLPAVSWVASAATEHPPQTACAGENETVTDINAIMSGPAWSSTVIFVVWDEWGGFYDHVPPLRVDNYSYGFRVPLLIISPWVQYGPGSNGGYVTDTFLSHASILKFIEDNWTIPPLNDRDANSNDIMDAFNFGQVPKSTLTLTTRKCAKLTPRQRELANEAAGED